MRKVSRKTLIMFLGLPLILYSVFFIYPAIKAFYISLTDWNGLAKEVHFVGLSNYKQMFADPIFKTALENTLIYTVGAGILVFALSLFFSYLLSLQRMKGKKFFRGLFYFPNMISSSAIALLFVFVLNPSFGLLANLLDSIGLESWISAWLGDRWSTLICVILISAWTSVGYYFLIFMSGIDKISGSYYEAARLDGASDFQIFTKITMPLLKDITIINMVLWLIGGVKYFDMIWALTQGGPANQTHTLATYMYQNAYGVRYVTINNKGLGTATAVVMLLLIAFGRLLVNKITKESESVEY